MCAGQSDRRPRTMYDVLSLSVLRMSWLVYYWLSVMPSGDASSEVSSSYPIDKLQTAHTSSPDDWNEKTRWRALTSTTFFFAIPSSERARRANEVLCSVTHPMYPTRSCVFWHCGDKAKEEVMMCV